MDDIHVTVLWVVSLTHGKARGTLSQLLHHDRTKQRECFSEKRGCAPGQGIGYGFRPLCSKQGYNLARVCP